MSCDVSSLKSLWDESTDGGAGKCSSSTFVSFGIRTTDNFSVDFELGLESFSLCDATGVSFFTGTISAETVGLGSDKETDPISD